MASYVPPRDPFELQVAQVASATLEITDIGIRDNLVEIGMTHSGAQALSRGLVPLVGRYGTAESLCDAQTVEAIASHYRTLPKTGEWSSLAELRPGSTSPLVCVHPLGGNAFWYLPLARKIGGEQTIYGLHSQGLDLTEPVQRDIAEMAHTYIADLRRAAPHGPYALLGWSFGGAVAFEMARQLAPDDVVSFVAMCDVGPDDMAAIPDSADAAFGLLVHAVRLDHAAPELMSLGGSARVETLHRMCLQHERLPPGYLPEHLERMFAINHANLHAMHTYAFGQYSGDLIVFRAAQRDTGAESQVGRRDLGWRQYVDGDIAIESITGSHFDALSRTNIDVIAAYLQRRLRQAR
jgi:thioesterase domain-containing protein